MVQKNAQVIPFIRSWVGSRFRYSTGEKPEETYQNVIPLKGGWKVNRIGSNEGQKVLSYFNGAILSIDTKLKPDGFLGDLYTHMRWEAETVLDQYMTGKKDVVYVKEMYTQMNRDLQEPDKLRKKFSKGF